jgi:hypothetical protein
MPPSRCAAPLLFLVACTGTPQVASPADRSRYAELLADTSPAPTEMLAACGALEDALLRGDCQLAALARADREYTGELSGWCGVVDRGRPRDECWFVVAERRMRGQQEAAAAEACSRSGRFEEDCERHLWEQAIVSLTRELAPSSWAYELHRAAGEIDRWGGILPGVDDLSSRMWTRFYERGLSRPGAPLDLGHCQPLPKPDATRCFVAGTALYQRRLARRADLAGADLCSQSPRASSWEALLPVVAHPRLDAAVVELIGERCPPE